MLVPAWVKPATLLASVALIIGLAYTKGRGDESTDNKLKTQAATIDQLNGKIADDARLRKLQEEQDAEELRIARQRAESDAATNRKLLATIDSLSKRPDRPTAAPGMPQASASGVPGATGAELYRPDAIFLAGEAARADRQQAALAECYDKLDATEATWAKARKPKD